MLERHRSLGNGVSQNCMFLRSPRSATFFGLENVHKIPGDFFEKLQNSEGGAFLLSVTSDVPESHF